MTRKACIGAGRSIRRELVGSCRSLDTLDESKTSLHPIVLEEDALVAVLWPDLGLIKLVPPWKQVHRPMPVVDCGMVFGRELNGHSARGDWVGTCAGNLDFGVESRMMERGCYPGSGGCRTIDEDDVAFFDATLEL